MPKPRTEQVHREAQVETVVAKPFATTGGQYGPPMDPDYFIDPTSTRSLRNRRLGAVVTVIAPVTFVVILLLSLVNG